MIDVQNSAQEYFRHLIAQQEAEGLALRLMVSQPGTPAASCELSFCEPKEAQPDDQVIPLEGFDLYVEAASVPFLDEAHMAFEKDATGGELVVKAPNLRGAEPDDSSPLEQRINYLLASEVNPSLASHGGQVSLESVTEDGIVTLKFGGGCHGCGMVGVTLKEGVEKTLKAQLPEITEVRDATDHSTGENPYY
ncbi:MAG: NifU family protein [Lysobacterales bacterium]